MGVYENEDSEEMEQETAEVGSVKAQKRKRKSDEENDEDVSPDKKKDDPRNWVCSRGNCGFNNFYDRETCNMCHANKDGSGGDAKEEDWKCDTCGFSNFASRRKCKKCQEVDWNCSGCGTKNFASRLKCRVCHTSKAGGAGQSAEEVQKGGIWLCKSCSFSNFAYRVNCKKCSEAKPAHAGDSTTTAGKSGDGEKEVIRTMRQLKAKLNKRSKGKAGDWTCKICDFPNFASRFNCKRCAEAKPAGASDTTTGPSAGASESATPWLTITLDEPKATDESTSSTKTAKKRPNTTNQTKDVESTAGDGSTSSGEPPKKRPKAGPKHPKLPEEERIEKIQRRSHMPGDWECTGCKFWNFANRSECYQCKEAKSDEAVVDTASDNWNCKCGFSNFPDRTSCKSCKEKKSVSVVEHRVGMSNMNYAREQCTTESNIKEFFLPLEPESIKMQYKKGLPQGKANVFFKSHEDAVKAMEKDKADLGGRKINLYLNSIEGGLTKPDETKTADNPVKETTDDIIMETVDDSIKEAAVDTIKDTTTDPVKETTEDSMKEMLRCFDDTMKEAADESVKEAADDTMNDTVEDAMKKRVDNTINDTVNETIDINETINETIDTDASTSEKKKFKWIKMIKSCLKSTDDKTASVKQLIKVLFPKYKEQTGEDCSKKEFQIKLEKRLSTNFTYENGKVSMSS